MAAGQYHVYIIKLDEGFALTRAAREANPEMDADKPCIYIGYTSKSPEARYEEHITGCRSKKGFPLYSRKVRRWGVCLLPEMYEDYNPIRSRERAMKLEKKLTEKFRRRGYTVWSN
ncbi:MAG: ribose-5-phosphate isomerase [candidate division Zixibacteria bacterium HGW-Zixibacteria-1]|nr:MAG: ribose-5-phosphate isomerase [candidate division Zixibacteria bacterium HGW-Zixibacteria-1]